MNNLTLLKSVCNLIKTFMELQEDQVYIYNQKFLIPNDTRLYVCVGQQGETIYSNIDVIKDEDEYISVHKLITLAINIYSYDFIALERKDEIPMCFNSILCEQEMEKIDFKIARIPTTNNNISQTVGTKMLYRYDYTFHVISGNQKILKSNYYLFSNQKIFKE